jgi:carbonic anhydrase
MFTYFILLLCVYAATGASWGYKVVKNEEVVLPKGWAIINPNCAGQKQSPIDIEYELTAFDSTLNAINFNRIDPNRSVSETWTLKNNGKTGKLRKIKN